MTVTTPVAAPGQWPSITDVATIEADNTKALIERADAYLKGQDDGLKGMEARMTSLFGQSVTLASAAVAATVTAYAAGGAPAGSNPPVWALPWVVPSLVIVSVFWLCSVIVAASAMLSQNWQVGGMAPREFYDQVMLHAHPNSLRLAISRALQRAIDDNATVARRYSRRLSFVIALLAAGPVLAAIAALWSTQSRWAQMVTALSATMVLIWCGNAAVRWIRTPS